MGEGDRENKNGKKSQKMARNGKIWQEVAKNGKKWQDMARSGKKWQETGKIPPSRKSQLSCKQKRSYYIPNYSHPKLYSHVQYSCVKRKHPK
ncbi:hypothetical protein POVWA1_004910 [Plasmodium ovale wallikeri]|uniref:Uncharacterized protein n=1 Tax=Plasmodium ovale wallikeri TaxID=864142 RepID=A0A1A8YHH4_PLAOA|nr:hypothetical protein POVWA1_004910 [Plasmodium ovale wallikeri]